MDLRWTGGDTNRIRALAQELVDLQPDIILTDGTPATIALQRETQTIPIVFAKPWTTPLPAHRRAARPPEWEHHWLLPTSKGRWEASGLSCSRRSLPASNGSPSCSIPTPSLQSTFMPSFETAVRSLKVEPITAPVRSDVEIETAIIALGREPGGGLVVTPGAFTLRIARRLY